jgi:hypothetical protein
MIREMYSVSGNRPVIMKIGPATRAICDRCVLQVLAHMEIFASSHEKANPPPSSLKAILVLLISTLSEIGGRVAHVSLLRHRIAERQPWISQI